MLVLFCSLIVMTGLVLEFWRSVLASDLVSCVLGKLTWLPKHLPPHKPIMANRSFAQSGHMVQNHTRWDASCTVEILKQRQVKVEWYELLCFGSPTVQLASQQEWFCTMWLDRAKDLIAGTIQTESREVIVIDYQHALSVSGGDSSNGRFPFKRNSESFVNFSENPDIVEFLKREPFNWKFRKLRKESQILGKKFPQLPVYVASLSSFPEILEMLF